MAQVDFSHAVLEPYTGIKPLSMDQNLAIEACGSLVSSSKQSVVTNLAINTLSETATRKIKTYNGTFSTSGTECYLYWYFGIGNEAIYWRISNITFSAGDTFSFAIQIDVNGNG